MANSLLDGLPPHSWFFGFELIVSTYLIAVIGILHPLGYYYSCKHRADKYRDDYRYAVAWIMTTIWFFFSIVLLVGIIVSWELGYEAWIWFMFVFSTIMCLVWAVMLYQYFYCTSRRPKPPKFFLLLLILLCYAMTFYFIFVVNTQRMQIFSKKELKAVEAPDLPVTPLLPDMF